MHQYQYLLDRIAQCSAQIGVMGLGYIGLPLALEWATAGFPVTGIDTDLDRVVMCQQGKSWIPGVSSDDIIKLLNDGHLRATSDIEILSELDVVVICVPTPLNEMKDPDISAVNSAVEAIATHLHRGQLIVLESTTYPGTTDELILPRLGQTNLSVGVDFFLAYSPERTDPGNSQYSLRNTPKIVAGITPTCLEVTMALYKTVVNTVIPVSSTRAAELTKLHENTFRAINIGMVNELAIIANLLGVDVWEVISAAGTKPFGFMPFYPGPGIGGHCIPIDPQYLTWKLRTLGYRSRLIEIAGEINEQMPRYIIERVNSAMNEVGKCLKGSRVLIVGVTYKHDVGDLRESPAIDIIELLREHKAHVDFTDPYIPTLRLTGITLIAVPLDDEHLRSADCVVIVTDHHVFDYSYIARMASLIVDVRNAMVGIMGSHIRRL